MNNAQNPTRTLRIIKSGLIVYGALVFFVVFRLPAKPQPPNRPFELIISAFALASLVFGFTGPRAMRRMAEKSKAALRSTPEKQWMARNILSLASFVACMLYGVVLHFTGAGAAIADILIGAGMVALIVWKAEPLPISSDGSITQY